MASRTVRARLDPASERALELLLAGGGTESEVVRGALVETAERRRRGSALAEEARALMDDSADAAARARVMRDMDALAPGWPE
ncbi:MAG TPA: hypothetical protein VFK38_10415 [Candidatus Limnocylindrales bacterium]|nr:hypothetical protein [Candidatus Limnocylindrales bacterium]